MFNIEIHAQEKKIKSEQKHFAFVCLIPYMKHKRACKGKKQRSEGESEYGVIYSQLKLFVCIYIRTFHGGNGMSNSSFTAITVHFHLDFNCL